MACDSGGGTSGLAGNDFLYFLSEKPLWIFSAKADSKGIAVKSRQTLRFRT